MKINFDEKKLARKLSFLEPEIVYRVAEKNMMDVEEASRMFANKVVPYVSKHLREFTEQGREYILEVALKLIRKREKNY